MRGTDQFHVGIVVDDLESALADLTQLFGYRWCEPISVSTPVVFPAGDAMVDLTFTYSTTTPRVEVIRSVPGTLWTPVAGSGIHHLGYWSDDVPGDAALLAAQGYAAEAAGAQPGGDPSWAYHRRFDGPRIEIVSRRLQPGLEQWWASSPLP
ncbi:MAG: VOC family protein [Acidimicrobiales bacterium]